MRKILFLFFTIFLSFQIFSQTLASAEGDEKTEEKIEPSEHGEKKFAVNIFYSPVMSVPIMGDAEIKNPRNFFGVDLFYRAKKTYHYLEYDILKTAIASKNGYFVSDKFGAFVFFSRELKKQHSEDNESLSLNVMSMGIDYFIEHKYVDFIIFSEIGTEFLKSKEFGRNDFLSIGLILEGHIFRF